MRTWITWLRWRLAQALGRNPLVRTTDRIETLVLAVAVVLSLAAIPVSAATAVEVHDKRVRTYAAEAQARRPVVANIIGTKAKDTHLRAAAVQNRWPLGGGPQAEPLRGPAPTSIGDHRQTWLNRHGEHVAPPSPSWRAGVDAWARDGGSRHPVRTGAVLAQPRSPRRMGARHPEPGRRRR
jgi:hypothetical protein